MLVDRGLAGSRERARALILAGQVVVDDHRVDKVGQQVEDDAQIRLKGDGNPYVSRGGLKLEKALKTFELSVSGRVAIDVGASTGGFTDCLLQQGVLRVYAVDVGYGQLAHRLRQDPRVINLERCNIRKLEARQLPEQPDLAVIDASFISLQKVLPPVLQLLADSADLVALIKPQFEVGPKQVGKGGVVKDPLLHQQAVATIRDCARALHVRVSAVTDSPIAGQKGNREFLIHLQKGSKRFP